MTKETGKENALYCELRTAVHEIKGAIFDVDGTLLDSMSVWENLGERYLEIHGIKAKPGLTEILNTMSTVQGIRYLIQQYGIKVSVEEAIEEVTRILHEFYSNQAPLKDGAKECLDIFKKKGLPMMIATSGERENVEAAFQRLGIRDYFQDILTCTQLDTDKTKPDIFQKAAMDLGTKPEETIVFEDALHALRSAKTAGFLTVAVYDLSEAAQEDEIRETADCYVRTLEKMKFL